MRSVGQAFCSATVAAVLADMTFLAAGHEAPTLGAYQLVFLIAAGAALLALAVTLCLPGARAGAGTVGGKRRSSGRTRPMPIQEGA